MEVNLMPTRMTWDQMVDSYPDQWLAISNPVMDGDYPDIMEGDVVAVLSDDEICAFKAGHRGQDLEYRRTTESPWNGIVYADFSITTV